MNERYRVVQLGSRKGTFYCKDNVDGSRTSLGTKNRKEAERLVRHKNEALRNPQINRKIGMAYLSATDPDVVKRTWQWVMDEIIKDKQGPTLKRYETAFKDPAYESLKPKTLVGTQPSDFLEALRIGSVSTNVYLRRLQNFAVDMDWVTKRILPKRLFPKISHKEQRAITWDEHRQIIAREKNPERRDFYELCWYFGGSQSDIANLHAEDIDYGRRGFVYDRLKSSKMAGCRIGPKAWEVVLRRPRSGPLFPYLLTVREADRATEFRQRCQGLGIKGVTLHSYRYAWAERSADTGYPERYAQRVLGQNSKIVHRVYAKKAQKQLPSLEEYEEATLEAQREGKIIRLEAESEVPKVADPGHRS